MPPHTSASTGFASFSNESKIGIHVLSDSWSSLCASATTIFISRALPVPVRESRILTNADCASAVTPASSNSIKEASAEANQLVFSNGATDAAPTCDVQMYCF